MIRRGLQIVRQIGYRASRLLIGGMNMLIPFIAGSRVAGWVLRLIVRKMPKSRRQLIFCPTPLINNKYWAAALKEAGHDAVTLMTHHYAVYKRSDFDLYYDELVEARPAKLLRRFPFFPDLVAFFHVIANAKVVHIPFTGGPLGSTPFWRHECQLYQAAGIKVVVIPYGGDAHMYSAILNTSMRNALLIDYPAAARNERSIRERVDYWASQADC